MRSSEEEYENKKVLIWKVIAAEKKTRDRSALQIEKVDQYYSRGHRPTLQANKHQLKKRQSQGLIKDPRQQKPKLSSSVPQSQRRNEANRREEKKF